MCSHLCCVNFFLKCIAWQGFLVSNLADFEDVGRLKKKRNKDFAQLLVAFIPYVNPTTDAYQD